MSRPSLNIWFPILYSIIMPLLDILTILFAFMASQYSIICILDTFGGLFIKLIKI